MKTKDIASTYQISKDGFESFLKENGLAYKVGMTGTVVDDSKVQTYVDMYKKAAVEQAEEEQRKRKALSQMLISSGFSFDGYRIVKYSGYISGDDATQIPRTGIWEKSNNGQNLTDALVKIRRQALIELKEAAYDLGCNAVIGVDFDYITIEPQTANFTGGTTYEPYIICVTANGNAVCIEKLDGE